MSNQSYLYNALNNAWTIQYGAVLGRNNFYKVDLYSMTGTIDFHTAGANLQSLGTANGAYLFKYIPNVTGIILDGCTEITNSFTQDEEVIPQMNFSEMIALQTLSVQNCTGLTSALDLTACTDIRQVDASGTTINILVPEGAKLTKYEVGTPTSISLVNPTVLTPAQVSVDSNANITSLDLINIPDNKSFNMFYKIMQTS